jgi:1-acyl-sn-glycerol-3-phosphate acyltransferase
MVLKRTLRFVFKIFGVYSIKKPLVMPDGACIVCPNHRSIFEVILIGILLPREVRFIAKAELFVFKPFGWLISILGAIPIKRNSVDKDAYKEAIKILENGEPLLIFPQGTRAKEVDINKGKNGPVALSAKTSAPILPIGMYGKYRFLRSRVIINPGELMSFDDLEPDSPSKDIRPKTQKLMQEIKLLCE